MYRDGAAEELLALLEGLSEETLLECFSLSDKVVLMRKPTRQEDINIVLAYVPGHYQRFVTWVENCTRTQWEEGIGTVHVPFFALGHYHYTLSEALEDYERRS